MRLNFSILILGWLFGVLLATMPLDSQAASLRMRGGTVTPEPPTTETCPLGLLYTSFDGCLDAQPTAQFKDPNLVATYALSATGQAQTIYHIGPFNKAGIDFGVGQTTTTGKLDPRDGSVIGVAVLGTTSVTFVSIANGGVPKVGMYVWDKPANGTAWFPTQNAPKINGACTGALPALVCPLDRTITARGGFNVWASLWAGCVVETAGIDWSTAPGDQSTTMDVVRCNFTNSMNGMTATINNYTFAAVNGHPATILSALSSPTGLSWGHVEIINSYLTVDSNSSGNNILTAGIANPNIRLTIRDSECDGGNSGAPLAGPFTYPAWIGCMSWNSPGSATFGRNQLYVLNMNAHDWAGNPFVVPVGNVDLVFQNLVTNRVNLNCGNDTPPVGTSNGCHGTIFSASTTITGSSASIKIQNLTAIYPYGQRNGVISGAVSLQGGIGSGATLNIEINGLTVLSNAGITPGHAVLSTLARVARVGALSSLKMRHIYANSPGVYQCFYAEGDIQNPNNGAASMSANTGINTSIMTWSGISGQVPIPFPGQYVVTGDGSNATRFNGTLTDNGNGTSTLSIVFGAPASSIAAKRQIVALRMVDPQANPTLVVSGSGSTYIVSNGSGSGENRAAQWFTVAQVIMPVGSINPNTGLPTTATFTGSTASANGTMLMGGERTQSSTNTWDDVGVRIGNVSTIDADISDLWMMNIAGDGGRISLDGVNLGDGLCPGTQPP